MPRYLLILLAVYLILCFSFHKRSSLLPSSCLAPAPPAAAAARCKVAVVDLAVFKLKQLSRITRCESSKSSERLEVYLN